MKFYDENGICIVCGFKGVDLHHFKHKGSGGSDESWNLIKLCHKHHVEIHSNGKDSFINKYPKLRDWLLDNGWENINGRWMR